jgi:hypothetical protein
LRWVFSIATAAIVAGNGCQFVQSQHASGKTEDLSE